MVWIESVGDLGGVVTEVMDRFAGERKTFREAPEGEEFHFMKSIIFTAPTTYAASDLKEFLECLKRVSIGCLYNHIFEARLRPPLGRADFSHWLEHGLNEGDLARKIERLDPYTYTLEGLRKKIVHLVERRLGSGVQDASV